jgi:hypothetical protein
MNMDPGMQSRNVGMFTSANEGHGHYGILHSIKYNSQAKTATLLYPTPIYMQNL